MLENEYFSNTKGQFGASQKIIYATVSTAPCSRHCSTHSKYTLSHQWGSVELVERTFHFDML